MEYAIRTTQTFEQLVKALTLALEDKGFTVQRSFDLQNALAGQAEQGANYCILAVAPTSALHPSQGNRILLVYQHKGQPILNLLRTSTPLPRHQAAKATSPCLESALVALLLERGWWSMEDVQTDF